MNTLATTFAAVSKLLLNSWSAEYALRLKPVNVDRDYLNQSLNWIYPQSYYAVFFSVRAVLAVDSINIANQDRIEKLLCQWSKLGHYGPVYIQEGDPFAELFDQRIKAQDSPRLLSGPEAAAIHVRLLQQVVKVNTIHETYIYNRLGGTAYLGIFSEIPQYLLDAFVLERCTSILNRAAS